MKFRKEEPDFHLERLLAVGVITSEEFLKRLPVLDTKLIESRYVRTTVEWAWGYWNKYRKPIGVHIQDTFHAHERSGAVTEDQVSNISDFLAGLSEEYERAEKFNVDYALEQTQRLFRTRKTRQLGEDILAYLSQGRLEDAEAALLQHESFTTISQTAIQPFLDKEAIIDAFDRQAEPLFTMPGALGQLVNEHLLREGFIGLMGPEKRGKTWWLMEFCLAALKARCNVAFFSVGDMSQAQFLRRLYVRLAGKSDRPQYCGNFLVPVLDCVLNQNNECQLDHRTCSSGIREGEELLPYGSHPPSYRACAECLKRTDLHWKGKSPYQGAVWYDERHIDSPLTWREAIVVGKKWRTRTTGRDFKLVTVPNNTMTVRGIEQQLDAWEITEGFLPDVVVIDYADILAPEHRGAEARQQENDRWKALRSLSQKKKNLIVTATQADAASYDSHLLKMKNFSEDKRKYAHVTGMIGLNQTEDEKRAGLMRLSWIVLREGEFDIARTVTVLQSLRIGRPHLASYWG